MRRVSIALALMCTGACSTNDGSLQIFAALTANSECVFSPDSNSYFTGGVFDPRGFGGVRPRSYTLGLGVRNTLAAPTVDSAGGDNANDAQIISIDACWFPAHPGSDGEPEFESYADGVPDDLSCKKLPGTQKKTVTTASPVPAGGVAGIAIELFEETVLQQLYGTGFEPWNIGDGGPIRLAQGDLVTWKYSFAAADPSDLGGRDAGWGNFPAQDSARIIVQARANAVLLSGGSIQSNWFIYPVDICVGCLAVTCGLQTMTECVEGGGPCADGNPCPPAGECPNGSHCILGSTCPDGSACATSPVCSDNTPCTSGSWSLEGNLPDPLADTACFPFQDVGPPCVAAAGCP